MEFTNFQEIADFQVEVCGLELGDYFEGLPMRACTIVGEKL